MTIVDTIRIDLPPTWQEVPVPSAGPDQLVQQAKAAERWESLSVPDQRRIELYLRKFALDLSNVGVVFAAVYTVLLGEDEADVSEGGGDQDLAPRHATVASAVISVLTSTMIGTDLPLTAPVLQAALSLQRDESTNPSVVRKRLLEPPASVNFECGPGVRLRQFIDGAVGREEFHLYGESFFLVMPDSTEALVMVEFATPHVAEHAAFAEYFEALCGTVRFYKPGDDTLP